MKMPFSIVQTSNRRNVLRAFAFFTAFRALVPAASPADSDAAPLVRKSLEAGARNEERLPSWISTSRVDEREFDSAGALKSEEISDFDQVLVHGVMVRRLILRDGRPVTAAERRKDDQRIARAVENARDTAKRKQKEQEFNQEILDGFAFHLSGEAIVAGRKAWVVAASPRPGFKPNDMRAGIFPHVHGKLWIDQQDFTWAKAEADAFEPVSIGFSIVAKLDEGAHFYIEQVRMTDGVWLPSRSGLRASARVAMVKRISVDHSTTFSNFRPAASIH